MILKNKGKVVKEILMNGCCVPLHRTFFVPADKESAEILAKLRGPENSNSVVFLDELLGIDGIPFKATYRAVCNIAKEAIRSPSYKAASRILSERHCHDISPAQVRRVTEYVGGLVAQDDFLRAEEAKQRLGEAVDNRKRRNDICYVQFDGSYYLERILDDNTNKHIGSNYKECKIAIAFLGSDLVHWGNESTEVKKRDIVGYIGSVDQFKYHLLALAKRNGIDTCRNRVFITDGAKYILPLLKELFPGSTYILDKFHAKENGANYATAVIRGKVKQQQCIDKINEYIDAGDPKGLLKFLEPYKNRKCPAGVVNFYEYVDRLQECMYYTEYEAKGFLVGSGHIESCHRYTMQDRMKRPGQQWNRESGQKILSLKARYESDKWDEVEALVKADYERCRSYSNQSAQIK